MTYQAPLPIELPFRELLDQVNDIVYTRDLDGVILTINAAGGRFFGREPSELVGGTLHDMFGDPGVRESLLATNAQLLAGGTDRSTVALVDASGRKCVLETNTTLIRNEAGHPIGACGVMRDVTEAAESSRLLSEALDQLRELDRVKAGFAAMLAHDLRSPLGTVTIALDLLRRQLETRRQEDLLPVAESATISCEGLLALVDEMLYIFRAESSEMALDLAPVNLPALVTEALAALGAQAARAGVRFDVSIAEPLPPLEADADRLRRVLTNLLTNALKFTPEGGEVRVDIRAGGGWIELRVSDTGEGIRPDLLPHIFDPYWQGPSKRGRFGTGLGLAIVKNIVEAHGGDVRVESELGEGSVFTVRLKV